MVKILIAIITTAVCINLAAQDVIYMSNGNTINAVVLKISEELIQFKKEENRDGPIYEKSLKNIDSIRYKNGFVESFTAQLVLNSYLEETTDKIIFNSIDSTSVDEIIIDGIRFLTIPLFINIDQEYSDAFNNMFWVHLRSEF
ncbi:MAG: hypothetical protein DRI89_09875 [Bacteroidetes bacterium]|nr:MAG: hypothetical protein DRI89_09875 [Bacteroidota bacterium]